MKILLLLAAFSVSQLFASVSVELTAPASTIPLGETLTFSAAGHDSDVPGARFSYQFSVRPSGVGAFGSVQDYYWTNTFPWTPSAHEGRFDIGVTAWSSATQQSASTYITVYASSRLSGNEPVVSNTRNPLVAFYSAPACKAPARMRVRFQGGPANQSVFTPLETCDGLSMNFYIGGMAANSTYSMQYLLYSGSATTAGPELSYRTGSIPASVNIPNHFKLAGPEQPTSTSYPFLLRASGGANAFATDLNENVVWYLGETRTNDSGYMVRSVEGGTFLAIQDDQPNDHRFLREFDMAGNVIHQTAWGILNDEANALRARQHRPPVRINFIHHDAIRLPNGYTATLVTDEEVKDQGAGPVDVLGDALLVLNQNWQVVWLWDAFDSLDVKRKPVLDGDMECFAGKPPCPAQLNNRGANGQLYTQATDWLHANSIYYDSRDGDLLVSLRAQSWVIRVAYENGGGDGHIVWRLGYGGDFKLAGGYPATDWFSGQHDAEFQANNLLTLFDNNNPASPNHQPGGAAHGQVWHLDPVGLVATPVVDIDLGVVSLSIGSATRLSNGDYEFEAGAVAGTSLTFEFNAQENPAYKEQTDSGIYRTFRVPDLYTP